MSHPTDEQRMIDAEVAHAAELIREQGEREREHAEGHREEEEHWRNEQENQRLGAEIDREAAEHERQGAGAAPEMVELRRRVAALEHTVAELVRARQGRTGRGPAVAPRDDPAAGASAPD